MASLAISPIIEIFRWGLQPIAPFTWFGFQISTIDVVATFRLCLVLRQVREIMQATHVAKKSSEAIEEQSYAKRLATTLLVVYGGEALTGKLTNPSCPCSCWLNYDRLICHTAPMLGLPPSFMVSGVVPALYAAVQAIVDALPSVPIPSAELELPLSVLDGISRAYLLCSLIPPVVTTNSSSLLAASPWTLLVTSLVRDFI